MAETQRQKIEAAKGYAYKAAILAASGLAATLAGPNSRRALANPARSVTEPAAVKLMQKRLGIITQEIRQLSRIHKNNVWVKSADNGAGQKLIVSVPDGKRNGKTIYDQYAAYVKTGQTTPYETDIITGLDHPVLHFGDRFNTMISMHHNKGPGYTLDQETTGFVQVQKVNTNGTVYSYEYLPNSVRTKATKVSRGVIATVLDDYTSMAENIVQQASRGH
jgi:hypothetical protein